MPDWEQYLTSRDSRAIEELLEFLRIPSVSAVADHAPDVQRAGEWVVERLTAAGLENVKLYPTAGHPVVYGDWLHADRKPTILIYGHFDVQPAETSDGWSHPPFDPILRGERVYARGASDDKGNMLAPILAVEAVLKTAGKLPVNVKFMLEGQEEIGSPQLPEFIAANSSLLGCDLVLSADGGQHAEDQPSLNVGCKGLCALRVDVRGPSSDLHSGLYGGTVQNPIHALVRLLDSLRSPDGQILVDGFYDDVVPLSEDDRALIAAVPFEESAFKDQLGVEEVFGEPGYSTVERQWARPTLEINGIWGGFHGDGVKTVLPGEAHVAITCRLVPRQEPARILDCLEAHIQRNRPPGVQLTVHRYEAAARPYFIAPEHRGNQVASSVLREIYGKEPYYTRSGGSIPVLDLFQQRLGASTVSFAFGLDDEQFHAPDEFYRLSSFRRAQRAYCKLLQALAHVEPGELRAKAGG